MQRSHLYALMMARLGSLVHSSGMPPVSWLPIRTICTPRNGRAVRANFTQPGQQVCSQVRPGDATAQGMGNTCWQGASAIAAGATAAGSGAPGPRTDCTEGSGQGGSGPVRLLLSMSKKPSVLGRLSDAGRVPPMGMNPRNSKFSSVEGRECRPQKQTWGDQEGPMAPPHGTRNDARHSCCQTQANTGQHAWPSAPARSLDGSCQLGGSGPRRKFVGGWLLLPREMSVIVSGSFQPSGWGMVPRMPLSISTLRQGGGGGAVSAVPRACLGGIAFFAPSLAPHAPHLHTRANHMHPLVYMHMHHNMDMCPHSHTVHLAVGLA